MGKGAAWLRPVRGMGPAYLISKLGQAIAAAGRPAFVVAVVSLAFSGATLYITVLDRPRLTIYAGCYWQYGRGPGSFDEYFVIPVTVVNGGARGGAVVAFELVADKGGSARSFAGNFTVGGLNDEARRLFAPIAVAGHASASSAIVFTRRTRTNPPLIDLAKFAAPERFQVALKFQTAVPVSYSFVDRLFANPPTEALFEPLLRPDDLAPVLDDKPASFDACAPAIANSASATSK
jgi:hypothetical protein